MIKAVSKKKWTAAIKKDMRDLNKHFKKDKWPLNFLCSASQFQQDLLGFDISMRYWLELHKRGFVLYYDKKKKEFMIKKKNN